MRVMVAHNRYRSTTPSGENRLVEAEVALLRGGGVDVVEMISSSDDIKPGLRGILQSAPGPIYSPAGVRHFTSLLREARPDVVHLHQVAPLISPWVVRVAGHHEVPVVHTVHAYRHTCVNGLHLRDGHVCTDCIGSRLNLPSVVHGCYRESRAQTLPVTLGLDLHRRTWRDGVARFIALTTFMRDKLIEGGMPPGKIMVRPTWVPDPGHDLDIGRDVLFAGRLDAAKGIDRLLNAWANGGRVCGRRLRIAGDGPLAGLVAEAQRADPLIDWLGPLSSLGVVEAMRDSAYVVVPSRFFEGYPLVVAEAFGCGRAVLTVSGGSVGTIVNDEIGWVVDPTVEALTAHLGSIDDVDAAARGLAARAAYERDNSPQSGLDSLLQTYQDVM